MTISVAFLVQFFIFTQFSGKTNFERVIPKKVKFEDVEVNIPNDYDKYLKIIYGDNYMEIPPKEDRYNHIYNTVDFGPYK